MDTEKTLRFYDLFGRLANATQIVNQEPDIPLVESIVNEIAAMFRLSKGVTHFYRTPTDEANEIGETMISYDKGEECVPVHTVRFVTRLMSITTMTVYMTEDEPPLTEEELYMVDITMRMTLAFISRNRLQVIAEELAFYDDMGYRNIRSFFNYIVWKSRPGNLDGMVAVNYNLRNFSFVNDEIGRQGGDVVLRNHYERVAEIVGKKAIVARLGGDNFVCICSHTVLADLLDFLSDADIVYNDDGNTIPISAWVGVFIIPTGFSVQNPNDIMGKIMWCCNFAKTGGQDHVIYYNDTMKMNREKTKRIQRHFSSSLKNNEFQIYYQPKVNTITGEICGAEALCRWVKNDEILLPQDFIPALEETTDICKLDFYMLNLTCSHIRKWLDEGRTPVRVSVNLSRRHTLDDKLVATITSIIDKHEVPHELIEIELTETTTDVEFKDLQRIVTGLQEARIFTSVDDFGMGYSSLNLIRVIPWNVLKIDRVFLPLDGEDSSSIRSIMFRHVVAMVKEMGLECIVEGVESLAQLKVLKDNKCEQAQGFLFDRPLSIEEFEKRLDTRKYYV